MKGKIKRLVRERGFGFITAEDGKEVLFHRSTLAEQDFDVLEEGTSVEFNLEEVEEVLAHYFLHIQLGVAPFQ